METRRKKANACTRGSEKKGKKGKALLLRPTRMPDAQRERAVVYCQPVQRGRAASAGGDRAAAGETSATLFSPSSLFSLLSSLFSLLSSLFSSLFSLLSFLSYCSRGALRVAASPLVSCPLCRYCRSALGCEADSLACALLRSKSLSLPLTYLGLKVGHWRIPSHRRREMDGQRRN